MILAVSLLLLGVGISSSVDLFYSTFPYEKVPGIKLKQIDAGADEVYGVNDAGNIYHWENKKWKQVPGNLAYVSVGPSGLWGLDEYDNIYQMQECKWILVPVHLKQIDAGGDNFLSGVDAQGNVYCLEENYTVPGSSDVCFKRIEGTLKSYSCGSLGCWGVDSANRTYFRHDVSQTNCRGTYWEQIEGNMVMVDVGSDGYAFGIDQEGYTWRRGDISSEDPTGGSWIGMAIAENIKHLSYDNGSLWLINVHNDVYLCNTDPRKGFKVDI